MELHKSPRANSAPSSTRPSLLLAQGGFQCSNDRPSMDSGPSNASQSPYDMAELLASCLGARDAEVG